MKPFSHIIFFNLVSFPKVNINDLIWLLPKDNCSYECLIKPLIWDVIFSVQKKGNLRRVIAINPPAAAEEGTLIFLLQFP